MSALACDQISQPSQLGVLVVITMETVLPFLGELCGEVGGEESWEEVLDTVSSWGLLCLSVPSSDRDKIFFRE